MLTLYLVGWVITTRLTPSAFTAWEDSVNVWLAERRTSAWNVLSDIGSHLAETVTCLSVLAVLFVVLRLWLGRWRESVTLLAAIGGELLVFLAVTGVVNRARPVVEHLDVAPPTSSFPSGHTAAAVALYGCIAVIAYRDLRNRTLAGALVVVCVLVPLVVGASRLYRGMHHPSDVLFGLLGGGAWLLLVLSTLLLVRGPVRPR